MLTDSHDRIPNLEETNLLRLCFMRAQHDYSEKSSQLVLAELEHFFYNQTKRCAAFEFAGTGAGDLFVDRA